jgi:hypothetical protein
LEHPRHGTPDCCNTPNLKTVANRNRKQRPLWCAVMAMVALNEHLRFANRDRL